MDRRQNNGCRYKIVQGFVMAIADNTQRLVCFLFMRGYHDGEIRRTLHVDRPHLEAVKRQLAFDLKKAGIRMEN